IDNCLRAVRRDALFSPVASSRLPYSWMGERTSPLVHQNGFDVDYDWQIPGVERWLRQQGFTEDRLPYSQDSSREGLSVVVPVLHHQQHRATTGRVLVTTAPFGELDPQPIRILEQDNI